MKVILTNEKPNGVISGFEKKIQGYIPGQNPISRELNPGDNCIVGIL